MRMPKMFLLVWMAAVWGGVAAAAEPNEPADGWAFWGMADDEVAELRAGIVRGALELDVAPRYDNGRAGEGDVVTDVRAYALYHGLTAEMAAKFWDGVALPPGSLYAGLYGGIELTDEQLEAGWCVGGRVQLAADARSTLEACTEYQRCWQRPRDQDDRDFILAGLRYQFR